MDKTWPAFGAVVFLVVLAGCVNQAVFLDVENKLDADGNRVDKDVVVLLPEEKMLFEENQTYLQYNGTLYKTTFVPEENKVYVYEEPIEFFTNLSENNIYIYTNGSLTSTNIPEGEQSFSVSRVTTQPTTKDASQSASSTTAKEEIISSNEDSGRSEGSGGAATSVRYELGPVPNWILEKGKSYIIFYVGEDYFDKHIFVDKAYFKGSWRYEIYYGYRFKVKGDVSNTTHYFTLFFSPGGDFIGKVKGPPEKRYSFNVSRADVIEAALGRDLPSADSVGVTYGPSILGTGNVSQESYIWSVGVEIKNYNRDKPEVVYVDVDSGEVLGIYSSNRVLMRPPQVEEQRIRIEEIIMKAYPEILNKTVFLEVHTISESPLIVETYYVSRSSFYDNQATLVINLDNKTIISVVKHLWD